MTQHCARLLLAALAAAPLWALPPDVRAEEPMATDRPDFVESSDVVGPGRVQIETGYASERSNVDGTRVRGHATPTLLRIGVSGPLELRIETDGFLRTHTRADGVDSRERGFGDASLGVKWHVQDGDEASGKPGLALLVHADVDSGSVAFRGQGVRPSVRGVAEWELPKGFSAGVMPGLVFDRNAEGKRYTGVILAATVGYAWTDTWRGFAELAGQQLASRKNGGNVVSFDTGVVYQPTPSLQFDLSLARGLTRQTPDLQWGLGVSTRF